MCLSHRCLKFPKVPRSLLLVLRTAALFCMLSVDIYGWVGGVFFHPKLPQFINGSVNTALFLPVAVLHYPGCLLFIWSCLKLHFILMFAFVSRLLCYLKATSQKWKSVINCHWSPFSCFHMSQNASYFDVWDCHFMYTCITCSSISSFPLGDRLNHTCSIKLTVLRHHNQLVCCCISKSHISCL